GGPPVYNGGMANSASRRDFLKGKAALGAVRDSIDEVLDEVLDGSPDGSPEDGTLGSAPPPAGPLLTLSRKAMACDFEVCLNASPDENHTDAALAALDLVQRLESQLTVYRPDSEVMAINRSAAAGPVAVEPRLFAVLEWMDRLHRLTGGAYDGASGPLSAAWGFSRRDGRVPTDAELDDARDRVGWDRVQLDQLAKTIAFAEAGVEINLNSVGKGYALDRAAELLFQNDVDAFLVQGGRSTLVARGSRRRADAEQADAVSGDGWGVGLRHPLRPAVRIAEFRLRDAAFSTSGSGTQAFVHQGKRYGHLLDPRTGWPAEGLHSVSVIAPTGAEADALSTALYVMGADDGERFLADHPQWAALFVEPGEHAGGVTLRPVNLADDAWRALAR
ncbi:MAG: FAD:protein FMN transferase, partial [Planctomycetota bacterium]